MNECPKCGGTKWKTIHKHKTWQCRTCGFVKGEHERVSS